jgi:hypothetical protein
MGTVATGNIFEWYRPYALVRRTGTVSYQTDAPAVFCTFLRAQGFTLGSFIPYRRMTQFVGAHLGSGEVAVFGESGLIIAKGEQVLQFLNSIVEWSGGRDE